MTPKDIDSIQKKTGIILPAWYAKFATNYPNELSETESPDYGLLDDPDEIIEQNIDVRENGYFGEK